MTDPTRNDEKGMGSEPVDNAPEHDIESCPTCRPLGLVWDPRVDGNVVPCPYAADGRRPPSAFRRHPIGDGELERKPTSRSAT